jgi:hypothetical protein
MEMAMDKHDNGKLLFVVTFDRSAVLAAMRLKALKAARTEYMSAAEAELQALSKMQTIEEWYQKFGEATADNARTRFGHEPKIEQVGLYVDPFNSRDVFTGIVPAEGLIVRDKDNPPNLVLSDEPGEEGMVEVMCLLKEAFEGTPLNGMAFTWVVTPLADLFKTGVLHIKGMGGISGNG